MPNFVSRFLRKLNSLSATLTDISSRQAIIERRLTTLAIIERERYVETLLSDPLYRKERRLERFGYKVYSQNDEDGIIQEIFRRIGTTARTFVECGVQNGLENNTLTLLLKGWSGLWIEGSEDCVLHIQKTFRDVISTGRLRVRRAFIDRDNINSLITEHFNGDIDLLSIDIDGNDIYILDSVNVITPRVIVIEYNGKFPPPVDVAQEYNPDHRWDGTDYGGSSLAAVTRVAKDKGYCLVGCGVAGVNAFFIRNDLVGDKFDLPFTAENHYQPARYFLWQTFVSGHPPNWGPYDSR